MARRILAVAALTALATVAAPAAASAGPAPRPSGPGWQPYRSGPFVDAPGAVCSFGIAATPVEDREQYRTLSSYPDGSPRLQEYRGPLRYRYTNETSGRSVVRNLSGYAYYRTRTDGSVVALFLQHGGTTVPVGNHGFPAGEWVFSGPFVVVSAANGEKHVRLLHARAENLCTTLA